MTEVPANLAVQGAAECSAPTPNLKQGLLFTDLPDAQHWRAPPTGSVSHTLLVRLAQASHDCPAGLDGRGYGEAEH